MRRVRMPAVLLLFSVLAASCGIVGLGGGSGYEVTAYFPRAVSLYEQGGVQVLGLPAGKVTDVEIVGDQVKVVMRIDDDIELPADVQAAIVPQSLIGERRVQLFPAYRAGMARAEDGHVITIDDTIVPIEPDEALAALKEFLDSLNPDGLGRLIDNTASALDGQGADLGEALSELSELVGNFEENDDDIIRIAEQFDEFTRTLLTRETQIAEVLDEFAIMTDVLADERDDIERLVAGLAGLSGEGLDLVSEHAVRLRTDIDIVTRLLRSVDANLDGVEALLEAGPSLISGFEDAFDEPTRSFTLRQNFGPLLEEALAPLFDQLGIPLPCIPVDTVCQGDDPLVGLPVEGLDDGDAVLIEIAAPTSPVNDVLALLSSPTMPAPTPADVGSSSVLDDVLGTFLGVGT